MAEFDKNTKGIAFIFFCRNCHFLIIKYMAHKDHFAKFGVLFKYMAIRIKRNANGMSQNSYIFFCRKLTLFPWQFKIWPFFKLT